LLDVHNKYTSIVSIVLWNVLQNIIYKNDTLKHSDMEYLSRAEN